MQVSTKVVSLPREYLFSDPHASQLEGKGTQNDWSGVPLGAGRRAHVWATFALSTRRIIQRTFPARGLRDNEPSGHSSPGAQRDAAPIFVFLRSTPHTLRLQGKGTKDQQRATGPQLSLTFGVKRLEFGVQVKSTPNAKRQT